jgi:hypothetical protein
MKLLDILKELEKPKQIYAPGQGPSSDSDKLTIANLSPRDREKLFQQGTLMITLPTDPSRPETSISQVINLPKIDQIKREVLTNKKEFDVFMFSTDPDIKVIAKEINNLYNKLFRAMNALDKSIELKRKGRI